MCKVLMIAGIKKKHQAKVKKIMEVAAKTLAKVDDDGIGYAAITSQGKIYGEKWINKDLAFKIHREPKTDYGHMFLETLLDRAAKWENAPSKEDVYARFGTLNKETVEDTVGVIMHARKSTVGGKSIINTHPFFELDSKDTEDTAIIHNGGITNHLTLTKKYSTCDSEVILHEYLKNMMNWNPYGIKEFSEAVEGEYTIGVLSSANHKIEGIVPTLDIFKYKKDLFVGYCPDIETAIFTTWKFHLEEICREAGVAIRNIAEVRDEFFMRINALTGERIDDLIEFKGKDKQVYPYAGVNSIPWKGGPNNYNSMADDDRDVASSTGTSDPLTGDDIEDTIETAKKFFETKHSELFTTKYQTVALNKQEQELMDALAKAKNTDLRALKLVQLAFGIGVKTGV